MFGMSQKLEKPIHMIQFILLFNMHKKMAQISLLDNKKTQTRCRNNNIKGLVKENNQRPESWNK